MSPMDALPTLPLPVDTLDLGWLLIAVWGPARDGDQVAQSLYRRIKAVAIEFGVEWRYGEEPWLTSVRERFGSAETSPSDFKK